MKKKRRKRKRMQDGCENVKNLLKRKCRKWFDESSSESSGETKRHT